MKNAIFTARVQGMICRQCEDAICEKLLFTRGVIQAEASYWKNLVKIEYDPAITDETTLRSMLEQTGYPAGDKGVGGIWVDVGCIVAIVLLYFALSRWKMSPIPSVGENAPLSYVFLIGLLTSTHCLTMCGGILLSQTVNTTLAQPSAHRMQSLTAALYYNGGRVLVCMLLGVLFGAAGWAITYTAKIKSMVFTLAGAGVVFIGLRMWGIFPGLRRVQVTLPGACKLPGKLRKRFMGRPLIIGMLTAIMPCGASYAMWLCAMSSGSAGRGAAVMLVWGLGTVPLMLLFGVFGSLIPQKYFKWMLKANVVLVMALGLKMLINGLRLV